MEHGYLFRRIRSVVELCVVNSRLDAPRDITGARASIHVRRQDPPGRLSLRFGSKLWKAHKIKMLASVGITPLADRVDSLVCSVGSNQQ
jgi:hypothetical protein